MNAKSSIVSSDRSTNKDQRGSAFFELALALPVLVILSFSAVDAVNWLTAQVSISLLSRDIGRASVDCAYALNQVEPCLRARLASQFRADSTATIAQTEFVVQVWEYTDIDVPPRNIARVSRGNFTPQIDALAVQNFPSYGENHLRIITVEFRKQVPSITSLTDSGAQGWAVF